MTNLDLVGLDLAKNVFQLHGCSSTGEVIFRQQLKRSKLLTFISELPTCTIPSPWQRRSAGAIS